MQDLQRGVWLVRHSHRTEHLRGLTASSAEGRTARFAACTSITHLEGRRGLGG